ncbi:PRC-barrel domain-containing protein [Halomicronema sp. CCY15110]|uniref:PRC-barrel domain-containing protein n=1 Tax=Halomicronema sp. CCY15110 TaxID=2767773 RepID=UPI00194F6C96|nr:PRC-barrel domain-containing protein [Halomicronema sp. CCY15110]
MTSLTTFPKTTLQQSSLLGRLILNHETTEEIGHVKEFWLDTTIHQVMAVVSESGLLGRTKQFLRWEQVEAIGEDSLLVSLTLEASEETPQGSELVIGHELWTDDGNKAGTITDYCLDLQTGAVVAYLFHSNGWQGLTDGVYVLLPEAVLSTGTKRLIAKADQVKAAEQFSAGLKDKLNQVTEYLKKDLARTRQDITALKESGQSTAAQVKEKTQQATAHVQTTVSDIAEQAHGVTQQVVDRAQSTLTDAGDRIQHTAHDVATQVQEKTKTAQTKSEKNSTSPTKETERSEANPLDDI